MAPAGMGGGDSADVGALRRLRAEVAELRRANEIELIGPYSTGQNWSGLREVERETAEWVRWYNHERIHSSIDYMTPIEREVMLVTPSPNGARWPEPQPLANPGRFNQNPQRP